MMGREAAGPPEMGDGRWEIGEGAGKPAACPTGGDVWWEFGGECCLPAACPTLRFVDVGVVRVLGGGVLFFFYG